MHESSGSLSSSPRSIARSSTAKAAPAASPIILPRFPELATEYDRSGLTNFNPVGLTSPNPIGDSGIYLLRTGGCALPPRRSQASVWMDARPSPKALSWVGSCPTSKVLLWLDSCPTPKALSWVGSCPALDMLPWVGSLSPPPHFSIFAHTSYVSRIHGFSVFPGRFVARVSAHVATTEGCTGRRSISPAADTFSLRILPYPSRAARAPQKPWLQRRPSHSLLIHQGVLHRKRPSPRPPVRLCPSPPCLAIQSPCRRRRADEQRQQRVVHPRCRLWVRAWRAPSAMV